MMIKEDERMESRKEPTEDFAKGDFTSPNVEEVSQRGEASGQHIGASETRRFLQRVHSGNYETATSLEQDLTFETTTRIFKEHFLDLEEGRQRILGLTDDEGYTNLAYMLSDQFTASIKVAAYVDDSMTAFAARRIFRGSVLGQLRDVLEFIELNNRLSSEIIGYKRQDTWQFPPTAIREAVINAIIHRDYAMDGSTIVHILPDRICITSPGSLNECYSAEDLRLGVSSSRNPLLADVFYRLEYCETYGSGIPRII
ncbi:MAG: hypothetical protein MJZ38_05525, partial [archaeon]|nr:hypothetical protein [archaeon]